MMHRTARRVLSVVSLALALGAASSAQDSDHDGQHLGRVDFRISCSEKAQASFNVAVSLLHHMTYPQARAAFEAIAEAEPGCAMAYWGVAMTLFQPLWPTRPGPEDLQRGAEAIGTAAALAPTARERLFIAAADSFFHNPAGDYWDRIRRWERGTLAVHRAFPDDPDASAFHALALLATAPAGGGSSDHQDRAAEILAAIRSTNPEHPGANHYFIHANDTPGRARETPEIVRHYADIAPRNPHALHMPTHIYTRLGEWDDVITGNLAAAEAALEHPAGEHGQWVWDEFPHAIEYLVYAYLQQGADSAAAAQIERMQSTQNLEPNIKTAFHLSSIPTRYALERQAWTDAAALRPRPYDTLPWDRFHWPEAVSWFGRGLGAAHLGRFDDASHALGRIQQLETAATTAGEELFARQIRVLHLDLAAWIAQLQGQEAPARALMEEAVALETSTPKPPVTPAPTLPALELLGDLLLLQDDAAGASAAYERSLELYPGRFNSLLGAARAARASGNDEAATAHYAALVAGAADLSSRVGLAEAREYLSGR